MYIHMQMMQTDLEHLLPTIREVLSKTVLVPNVIEKITGILLYDIIKTKCTEWINDSDTTIAMECDWTDWLVENIPLPFTKEELLSALDGTQSDGIVKIDVKHKQYGNQSVYVSIFHKYILVSTRKRLLYASNS